MSVLDSWVGYSEITLTNPTGTLTNFPLMINLASMPNTWWNNLTSTGIDIRAALPDDTILPLDVISCTTGAAGTRSGLVAVNYSGTLQTTGTQKVRLWVGNPSVTLSNPNSASGQYNAYPSGLTHFYWNGLGEDRTRNQNTLTLFSNPTVGGVSGPYSGTKATAVNAQYGNTSGNIPTGFPITLLGSINPVTIANGTLQPIIGITNTGSNTTYIQFSLQTGTYGIVRNGNFDPLETTITGTVGIWHRCALRAVNATNRIIYLNATGLQETGSCTFPSTVNSIYLGANYIAAGLGNWIVNSGSFGLVQIYNTDLGEAWISYDKLMNLPMSGNQSDFYTFGSWITTRPSNTVAPVITSTNFCITDTISTSDGLWDGGQLNNYNWQVANDNTGSNTQILNVTSNNFVLDETINGTQVGVKYIRSTVSYINSFGTTTGFSNWNGPIKVFRYISPTGSNTNSGTSTLPWATIEYASTYCTANTGIVNTLYIVSDSVSPLYVVTTGSIFFNGNAGSGLTIKKGPSVTETYADIRLWEACNGNTGTKYDNYFLSGVSTYPNVYFFNTRKEAAIWEYMGGRGDNLKWFNHITGIYNTTGHLTRLNNTSFSFCTISGTGTSNYFTFFNPGNSPSGRIFAVSYRPNQQIWGNQAEIDYGTIDGLCMGGSAGINESGTTAPGDVLHAEKGAVIKNSLLYAGGSHIGLAGDGAAVTWDNCIFGQGSPWEGVGAYTTNVWFSDVTTNPPIFLNCSCPSVFGLSGSISGSNFVGNTLLGNTNQLGTFLLSHGNGVDARQISVSGCNFGGKFASPVSGTNSTFGCLGVQATLQSCTISNHPSLQNGSGYTSTFSDCLILLNLTGADGSHYPNPIGTLSFQNCTFVNQNYFTGVGGPIFYGAAGPLDLRISGCIINLTGISNINVTDTLNVLTGDTYSAGYNIYITTGNNNLHAFMTASGIQNASATLAQTQSAGYELGSIINTGNSRTSLQSNFTVPTTSIAVNFVPARINGLDRTMVIFASRDTAGAYETELAKTLFKLNANNLIYLSAATVKTGGTRDISINNNRTINIDNFETKLQRVVKNVDPKQRGN